MTHRTLLIITNLILAAALLLVSDQIIILHRKIRYNRMITDQVECGHSQLFRQAFERIEYLEEQTRP